MRKAFGAKLRVQREKAGLTQAELARRSNLPLDSLRKWEQGRVLPRIDAVTRLARTLGVSLDLLAVDPSDQAGDTPPPKKKPARRRPPKPRG